MRIEARCINSIFGLCEGLFYVHYLEGGSGKFEVNHFSVFFNDMNIKFLMILASQLIEKDRKHVSILYD